MSFRKSSRFFTLAISAFLVAGIVPILAQEPKPETPQAPASASTPTAKKTYDPSRRVPDYFGQIGLTPEQKELFESWVLTAEFHDYPDGWFNVFEEAGYTGDYDWTIVE